ncbi:hypothetical protein BKG91_11090 [Rodentibacter caecimuris]|uniref:P22AR C-terminal domain-containing protein n=1 Tax=Rodentibacter caecimuris TaxID=1796644 RepID=UPI000750A528|nr:MULTISPECIES: P22AR C-terminal domain-containing protein [Pasteurellaceae]AOF53668.1 Phage tail fiber protein [Pasteurellaceae bacterium NI1060]OOF72105.1 hypothetical protein BKG91_11090 [Rodentibacter heylii]TGY50850.1 bacteriocin [Pasteurella caecimuris]
MTNIITADYNGTQVFFQDDAYLNATAIAKHFNKRPNDWLTLPTTQEYIETLCKKTETRKSGNAAKVGKSHFVKTIKGGKDLSQQGTWLHRRLAVPFARWLNVEFAIWCDEQIEKILIEKNQPKQLALPEPEKKFKFEFTEYELQLLPWIWFIALRGTETCRMIYPAMETIGSKYSGAIYGQAYEYKHTIREVHKLLKRLTADFKYDYESNWRVLKHLENYNPKSNNYQVI